MKYVENDLCVTDDGLMPTPLWAVVVLSTIMVPWISISMRCDGCSLLAFLFFFFFFLLVLCSLLMVYWWSLTEPFAGSNNEPLAMKMHEMEIIHTLYTSNRYRHRHSRAIRHLWTNNSWSNLFKKRRSMSTNDQRNTDNLFARMTPKQ